MPAPAGPRGAGAARELARRRGRPRARAPLLALAAWAAWRAGQPAAARAWVFAPPRRGGAPCREVWRRAADVEEGYVPDEDTVRRAAQASARTVSGSDEPVKPKFVMPPRVLTDAEVAAELMRRREEEIEREREELKATRPADYGEEITNAIIVTTIFGAALALYFLVLVYSDFRGRERAGGAVPEPSVWDYCGLPANDLKKLILPDSICIEKPRSQNPDFY